MTQKLRGLAGLAGDQASLGLSSQHRHGGFQPSLTLGPGNLMSSLNVMWYMDIHKGKIVTHIN